MPNLKPHHKKNNVYKKNPFGCSYIDLLPYDVSLIIFKMNHNIKFLPSIKMINKFKSVYDDELFKINIPLKALLKPISKRNFLLLDVDDYDGNIIFNANKDDVKNTENLMNITIKLEKTDDPLHHRIYRDKYLYALIKWKNDTKPLTLDIINIVKLLKLTIINNNNILTHLFVDEVNRVRDGIMLIFD